MTILQAKPAGSPPARAEELAQAVLKGDARVVGQVLSMIEDGGRLAREVLKRLFPRTGRAHVVGITGAAGSGKSTLIARLTEELRRREKTLGILSVDPTSPLTGGAFLGDRVRMREHFLDRAVFIRSLATRGHAGGISGALFEATQLLDAAGKDVILIETIGIGQDQVDVAGVAEAVVVVVTPENGDEIQAMKAGILEIADILVVNKADLPGAHEMFEKLSSVADLAGGNIFKTSALQNQGISALVDGVERHRAELRASGKHRQKMLSFARAQLLASLRGALIERLDRKLEQLDIDAWSRQIADRCSDPYSAAESILNTIGTM